MGNGRIANAIGAAQRYLLSIQREDGHWCGELEGDTILESEYVLTLYTLKVAGFSARPLETRFRKAAEYLRRKQLADGGWAIYEGGPPEVSSSVKAYFVLKLLGDDPRAPHMVKAREVIRRLGGVDACNSFTKIYLAIFGQCEWSRCPAVPPELVLLKDRAFFNIYKMSSWSRAIVVPLSIIWASKPSCPVPESASIDELWVETPHERPVNQQARSTKARAWIAFFRFADTLLKLIEAFKLTPLREEALKKAEAWMLERLDESDGLGAIFPPIINTILAFRCLGYGLNDPRLLTQVDELLRLEIEEDDTLRVQPCFSPVWDTALAMQGLLESGLDREHPALAKAAGWLLDREVRCEGDWKKACPDAAPGGWYFEYANEFYPDCDDVAEVLTVLARVRMPDPLLEKRRQDAIARGLAWQFAMQNADGGWAAFDKGCDNEILTLIPFADHNAMIDPSCEDITGRTLEALRMLDVPMSLPAAQRAIAFVKAKQKDDGTWYGRWGCNYLYGTYLALRGLAFAGEDMKQERYQRAAAWVRRHQNEDGGWGELPLSYDDPNRKGVGPSTPSQTAWALLTLVTAGDADSPSVARGVEYLLTQQEYDGSWKDSHWTGTGFPRVFYLRYHLYATYFPIWALAAVRKANQAQGVSAERAAREKIVEE